MIIFDGEKPNLNKKKCFNGNFFTFNKNLRRKYIYIKYLCIMEMIGIFLMGRAYWGDLLGLIGDCLWGGGASSSFFIC